MAKNDRAFARLRRVSELFVNGKAVVLDHDDDNPVAIWVQKLNTFQRQDAQKDADYGRNRRMAALTEDTEEILSIRRRIGDDTDEMLIAAILRPREEEFASAARSDVLADEDWAEKINALRDNATAEADGSYVPDEEREAINRIARDYMDHMRRHLERRREDAKVDLREKDRAKLEDLYVEAYRATQGAIAWADEYQRTQVWYALRDCVRGSDHDPWDFAIMAHPRLLDTRAQVYELPDELVDKVLLTIRELDMSPDEAGNSVAPRTSSAPSEQPGTEADSTPSTPAETSTKPDGTSSSPSQQPQPSSVG